MRSFAVPVLALLLLLHSGCREPAPDDAAGTSSAAATRLEHLLDVYAALWRGMAMRDGPLDLHAEYDRYGDALAAQLVIKQTESDLRGGPQALQVRIVIEGANASRLAEAAEALSRSMFLLAPPISDPPDQIAQRTFGRRPAWVTLAIAEVLDWIGWQRRSIEGTDPLRDLAHTLAAELRVVAGS